MTKKTIIITISSVLLLGAAIGTTIYFVRKNNNNNGTDTNGEDLSKKDLEKLVKDLTTNGGALGTVDESEYSATNLIPGSIKLVIGERGRKVALLQAMLNYFKGTKLKIDGVFGNQTRFALIKNGFPICVIAATCEVTDLEFLKLANKTKKDKRFKKLYNPKTNVAMKKVYATYSS